MAAQMQPKVLFGRKSHGRPDFRKKKQQQSRVFYGVIFYVYTNADNKGDEFRRKKNMEIQSGGEKMRNASGQQGENERQ